MQDVGTRGRGDALVDRLTGDNGCIAAAVERPAHGLNAGGGAGGRGSG